MQGPNKALHTTSGPAFYWALSSTPLHPFSLLWHWASCWKLKGTNQYLSNWILDAFPGVLLLWTDVACFRSLWEHWLYTPLWNSCIPSFIFFTLPCFILHRNIYHYLILPYICITILIMFLPISFRKLGILSIFAVESTVIRTVPSTEQTLRCLLKELIFIVHKIYMLFIL